MRSKYWEDLREDHSHPRRLTAVLQEATPRKKDFTAQPWLA